MKQAAEIVSVLFLSREQAGEGGRQRAQEDPQQNKQQLMTGEPVTDNMGAPA